MYPMFQKDLAYWRAQWRSLFLTYPVIVGIFIIIYGVLGIANTVLPMVVAVVSGIYANTLLWNGLVLDHGGDFPLVYTLPISYRNYLFSRTFYSLVLLVGFVITTWPTALLVEWGLGIFWPAVGPLPLMEMAWFPLTIGINLAIFLPFYLFFQFRTVRQERFFSLASIFLGTALSSLMSGVLGDWPLTSFALPGYLGAGCILLSGGICQLLFGGRRV